MYRNVRQACTSSIQIDIVHIEFILKRYNLVLEDEIKLNKASAQCHTLPSRRLEMCMARG